MDRKPAVVTINVGINDVWHRLSRPHDDAVLQKYRENVTKMVEMAQGAGARVILLAPTVIQEDPANEGNKRLPVLEAIQRWPDVFAAAIPICGGGDTGSAAKLKKLPIWAWHGDADNVINVSKTIRMVEAVTEAGGDPKATYVEKGGHAVWGNAYRDPELAKWLLKQKRGRPPSTDLDLGVEPAEKK